MCRYGICIIMNDEMKTIKNKQLTYYFVLVLFDLKKQNCMDQYNFPVILHIDNQVLHQLVSLNDFRMAYFVFEYLNFKDSFFLNFTQ